VHAEEFTTRERWSNEAEENAIERRFKAKRSSREVRLYSMRQVQQALGVGRTTAYALVAKGQLPSIRIGRALRVSELDLKEFVERNRV